MGQTWVPGPRWREVRPHSDDYRDRHALFEHDESGNVLRVWVLEPPLPTTPHTVIRVEWVENDSCAPLGPTVLVNFNGDWLILRSDQRFGLPMPHDVLANRITRYEVLASPGILRDGEAWASVRETTRRETAMDVLAQVRAVGWKPERLLDQIARDFGALS